MRFLAPLSELSLFDLLQFNLQEQFETPLAEGDPNQPVDGGSARVLLRLASALGHDELVRLLLTKGADASLSNNDGQTALDLAREHGHEEAVHLLEGD